MNEFFAASLVRGWVELVAIKRDVQRKPKAETPTLAQINQLNVLLQTGSKKYKGLLTICIQLQMAKTQNRIEHFVKILNASDETPFFAVINSELGGLTSTMQKELIERKYVFVPADKVKFFEQDKLFDDAVYGNFPAARGEIKEAGNCFAADLNTAAVFHLMRAVEYGLRALANDLKVPIPDEELEYREWKTIIDQIYSTVKTLTDSVQGTPKHKAELREFYNGVLAEFGGFKDVWRNHIMHVRKTCNESDAKSAFIYVGDFMKRLANRPSICLRGESGEITKEAAERYADGLMRQL